MPTIDLKCKDCNNDFYWTEEDQAFYKERGFDAPKRCYQCRQARKADRASRSAATQPAAPADTENFGNVWGPVRGRRGRD
jgi:hypothetical protein